MKSRGRGRRSSCLKSRRDEKFEPLTIDFSKNQMWRSSEIPLPSTSRPFNLSNPRLFDFSP